MLPAERQIKIKEWIQKRHNLKISELSERLKVSEMTIHRDIKALVEEGTVVKTFGGISLVHQHTQQNLTNSNECVYCSRPIHEKLAYRLILPNDNIETACCAHCGLLRQKQLGDKVMHAVCRDFLRHTTISAALATFVIDSTLDIGCCQPQVLAFEYFEHANQFVKGFSGKVLSFSDAMEIIHSKMQGHHCHHHSGELDHES